MRFWKKPQTLFLAPAALVLLAVTVYPVFYTFWLSFCRYHLVSGGPRFIWIENYRQLFGDARFWNALFNTVYFTAVSVSIELVLGLAIAVLMNRLFIGKGIMRAIVIVPWVIPTVVTAKMWEWMYNPDFGIFNYLLGININWLGSPTLAMNAAILMDVWKTTPFVILLLTAGLVNIPVDLYHAARIDGASEWTMFRRISLPLLKPLIIVVLIFRTIDAFRVFDAIYVLTGGGPGNKTETLSIYAYKVYFQTLRFGYGSAISVGIFIFVGLIALLYARQLRRETS